VVYEGSYGDGDTNEEYSGNLLILTKSMQSVKLCYNKILQFLTGSDS